MNKFNYFALIFFCATTLQAAPMPKDANEPDLCDSTLEYVKTINFLRGHKDIDVPESAARTIADKVSEGCNGAADRFSKIFLLIRGMGVDHGKSLEIAIDFSKQTTETQKNFYEIFQRAYLTEFFDFDYQSAFNIAFELAKSYKGNPKVARKDFLQLVKFCSQEKQLGLPVAFCAKLAVEIARLGQYYPDGVFKPFSGLYQKLRSKKPFGLSVRDSLDILRKVLQYGPKAPDNFIKGYQFALDPKGLDLRAKEALKFAMTMAQRSVTDLPPPVAKKVSTQYTGY